MERPNTITLALLGGVGILVLLLVAFALTRDSEQDRLGDYANFSVENVDLNKACIGQPVYDQVKRALFAQAMQARPEDSETYQRIGASASIRMENAAAEGEGRSPGLIDCVGSMAIDLPPGVTTAAGRRLLMSDIYYAVDPESRRVVQLRDATRIVSDLAALTIVPVPAAPPPAVHSDPLQPTDPLAPVPPGDPEDTADLPSDEY
jgi:hypothetical protein